MAEAVTIPPRPAGSWAAMPATSKTLRVGAGQAFSTLDQAYKAAGDGTRIEIMRGTTLYTTGLAVAKKNIVICDFGDMSYPQPKLIGKGSSSSYSALIDHRQGAEGLHVEGLDLGDEDADTKFRGVVTGGKNCTVTRCGGTSSLFEFFWATNTANGFHVYKNAAPKGTNGNFVYTSFGSQYGEIHENFAQHSVNEHNCRTHTSHLRVYQNTFNMSVRADGTIKATINLRQGTDIYVGYNTFGGVGTKPGGQCIIGPLANNPASDFISDVVFEHNTIKDCRQFQLFAGARNIKIRNNTIAKAGGTGTVFTIMGVSGKAPPWGEVKDNACTGGTLFSGDKSKLVRSGNTLNGNPAS